MSGVASSPFSTPFSTPCPPCRRLSPLLLLLLLATLISTTVGLGSNYYSVVDSTRLNMVLNTNEFSTISVVPPSYFGTIGSTTIVAVLPVLYHPDPSKIYFGLCAPTANCASLAYGGTYSSLSGCYPFLYSPLVADGGSNQFGVASSATLCDDPSTLTADGSWYYSHTGGAYVHFPSYPITTPFATTFAGSAVYGEWQLGVYDTVSGSGAYLNSWEIRFYSLSSFLPSFIPPLLRPPFPK